MADQKKDKWAARTRVIKAGPFTAKEMALIKARARKAGLTLEEYARVCHGLDPSVTPMAKKPAPASEDEIRQLLLDILPDVEAAVLFFQEWTRTGEVDRIQLRQHLENYGRYRRLLLIAAGEDPDSEELAPLPVDLLHS